MCPDLERGCKVEPLESLNDLERLVRLMADSKLGHSAARLVSASPAHWVTAPVTSRSHAGPNNFPTYHIQHGEHSLPNMETSLARDISFSAAATS